MRSYYPGRLLRLARFHHRHDERVRFEIFLRDGFDVFERNGFLSRVVLSRALVAEAVQFIEGGGGGEMAEFLPGDFLLGR